MYMLFVGVGMLCVGVSWLAVSRACPTPSHTRYVHTAAFPNVGVVADSNGFEVNRCTNNATTMPTMY